MTAKPRPTLARGSYFESIRIAEILRRESAGGVLLLIATVAALVAANSPLADAYQSLRDRVVGGTPFGLHLNLTVGHWTADGLLALFFLLVGLELKREFVAGDLRNVGTAIVPIVAAAGGVVVPALIFLGFASSGGGEAARGWAIPAATDIAFALAVLAVVGTHLPAAMRTFLLTLAVVDDLIAITIIAIFYADGVRPWWLLATAAPLALFAVLTHRGERFFERRAWAWPVLLLPLAALTWVFLHESGIHATIAGVLLGFAFPVRQGHGHGGLAELAEHRLRPLSTVVAVPLFAFFAAGVTVGSLPGLAAALTSPVGLGVAAGLVLGKTIGITLATWLVTRLRNASLDPDIAWIDVFGLAMLGGVGFTVSLLVAELAYRGDSYGEAATLAVLTGSALAAALASVVLGLRSRHYRLVEESEQLDADGDGVPDKFAPDS